MAVPEALDLRFSQPLVEKLGVLLLDVGGVAEHPVAEVDGGGSGVDRAAEAALDQRTAGCRCDRCARARARLLNQPRVAGQSPVPFLGFLAPPLIGTEIQEVNVAVCLDNMGRTGHGAGSTQNLSVIEVAILSHFTVTTREINKR